MSRRAAIYCHLGHERCCYCGSLFQPAPEGRYGTECGCSSFAANLRGGPCDGERWWVPRALLEHLPRFSRMPAGRGYLLTRVELTDGELTYLYEWDTSSGREAAEDRETAEAGGRA